MTDICFRKVKRAFSGEEIIVFERGKWQTPILVLEKKHIEDLLKVWKEEK